MNGNNYSTFASTGNFQFVHRPNIENVEQSSSVTKKQDFQLSDAEHNVKIVVRTPTMVEEQENIHSHGKSNTQSVVNTLIMVARDEIVHEEPMFVKKSQDSNVCIESGTNTSVFKAHESPQLAGKSNVGDIAETSTKQDNLRENVHFLMKSYDCAVCGKSFSKRNNLKVHETIHNPIKPYSCSLCGKSFRDSWLFKRHERVHSDEKPFKCDLCTKSFKETAHLKNHMTTHTGEKPHKCPVCGKGFTQKGNLKTHQRLHTGDKPYTCEVCHRGFRQKGNLKTHEMVHTDENPFKCTLCEKGFKQSNQLKLHMKAHESIAANNERANGSQDTVAATLWKKKKVGKSTDDKRKKSVKIEPLKGAQRRKNFKSSRSGLSKHKSSQPKEKKIYKCSVCGKYFPNGGNLKRHEAIHSDVKPFNCEFCGKGYAQRGNLSLHEQKMHPGEISKKDLQNRNVGLVKQEVDQEEILEDVLNDDLKLPAQETQPGNPLND